jgi:hypothetical protein
MLRECWKRYRCRRHHLLERGGVLIYIVLL